MIPDLETADVDSIRRFFIKAKNNLQASGGDGLRSWGMGCEAGG